MAVCALAAAADNEIDAAERYRIDDLVKTEPALQGFKAQKAIEILDDYVKALNANGATARGVLDRKIARMSGDFKKARTLMRLAYMVIAADHMIRPQEVQEFQRLCGVLALDPECLWEDMAVRYLVWDQTDEIALVKAPSLEVSRIVNGHVGRKWRVFKSLGEAKTAIIELVRQALDIRERQGDSADDLADFLERLPSLTADQVPSYRDVSA